MYGAGGLKRVPTDFIENYFYGRPEYEIQKLISNYLDRKINQISNLIQKTKTSIQKYKEYKKSLIFEAVTGKIDLRDYELKGGE
jgi:type I restriction enzyme S subunit